MPDTRDTLHIAARILLLPVLLGQAVFVRKRYIALPEPTGDRTGTIGQGPPLRLLILGDSSAVGVGVARQEQALLGQLTTHLAPHATVTYHLHAVTGAKTSDVLAWLDTLQEGPYDVAVTALGVNDVTKAVSLGRWQRQQTALLDRLTTQCGARKIVVSGLPPMGQFPLLPHPLRWVLGRQAARFDRHLHALVVARPACTMARIDLGLDKTNMSEDGFHPGPAVYAAWAKEIAQIILADRELLDGARGAP
ncbi:lysophospholipase L1-like esterase [Loktanella sp. PT4BL]|uniref:SGNH/GDSL hydrolase family protein n=1 Tax=Loktanella sp. PT4BL TaxID=2135611 RepID=UPI000D80FEE8|nr:SGNH/GDSL hydrolase family protein [Loktanella sp. PT4BL]PXW72604.1 lysophospholipase L1-like esterase [Loktanella sp. PT4BL]